MSSCESGAARLQELLLSESKPPLRARLHWFKLSAAEFALLTAMCERSSDGSCVRASVPRLAAFAKLSVRTVQNLIHGCDGKKGMVSKGWLSLLAPADRGKRKPAVYRINEFAFEPDVAVLKYLRADVRSIKLAVPKTTGATAAPVPVTGATAAPATGAAAAHDSKALSYSNSNTARARRGGSVEFDNYKTQRLASRAAEGSYNDSGGYSDADVRAFLEREGERQREREAKAAALKAEQERRAAARAANVADINAEIAAAGGLSAYMRARGVNI